MTIVTTHYRYKCPPKNRKPVEPEVPVIVRGGKSRRPDAGIGRRPKGKVRSNLAPNWERARQPAQKHIVQTRP